MLYLSLHVYSAEKETSKIHVYEGRGGSEPMKTLDKMHFQTVVLITVSSTINFHWIVTPFQILT